MAGETKTRSKRCCSIEHVRLVAELGTCDQLSNDPSEWNRCAGVISRRSGRRAEQCMLQA
jgi:hypothetical protein